MVLSEFPLHKVPATSWYPGHMARAIKGMKEKLSNKLDYVFEVRDARVPISCVNPIFETMFENKKRVIIYTKTDLAGPILNTISSVAPTSKSSNIIATFKINAKDANSTKETINYILETIREKYPKNQIYSNTFYLTGIVVGMPNVGKSTIINSLRRIGVGNAQKAAPVGKLPGHTTHISNEIKILDTPRFFIKDTPGIMFPRLDDKETVLKLALTAALKEEAVGEVLIAEYLLYRLNRLAQRGARMPFYVEYFKMCEPTDDIYVFLKQVCNRYKFLISGGTFDYKRAAVKLIRLYNEGFFGAFSLDD